MRGDYSELSLVVLPDAFESPDELLQDLQKFLAKGKSPSELVVVAADQSESCIRMRECGVKVVATGDLGKGGWLTAGVRESSRRFVVVIKGKGWQATDVDAMCDALYAGRDLVHARRPRDRRPSGGGLTSRLLRTCFGAPVHDLASPLVAFRREAYASLDLRCVGDEIEMELAIKAELHGWSTAEVDIAGAADRQATTRRIPLSVQWRRLRFILLYSPRWLLFLPGILMLCLAMVGYALVFLELRPFGVRFDAHTLVVASVLGCMGFQAVLFAVIVKTFAVTEGLMPPDARLTRLYAFLNLERGLAIGFVLMLCGIFAMFVGFGHWRDTDFGSLEYSRTMRLIVPGMTAIAFGFQIILWGVIASFLGVGRRDSKSISVVDLVHDSFVHNRRVRVLCKHLAAVMPQNARVLDVGSGDGLLASMLMARRPDLRIEGIDIGVREKTHIPVTAFDGNKIPFPDRSFDVVMFVDVLHHTNDPEVLLREAKRVASHAVVIKDHTRDGFLAGITLRFMDRVGNMRHSVPLPYNYWPRKRWMEAFEKLGFSIDNWIGRLGLYPIPANWLFDRSLHFVARLDVASK